MPASGNSGGIMSWLTVVLASRKQVQIWKENVLPTIFSSQSKEKTRSRSQTTLCIRSEKEKISTKSMNRKLIRLSEGRECAQHKLYEGEQKLRRAIGRREIPTAHFRRSTKNLNLNDFSCTKQLDGQIGLRGTRIACVEKMRIEKWALPRRSCKGLPRS